MENFIRTVIKVVSLAIWGIIGFIFWIPLLVRVTAVFSGAILIYAVNNQDTSPLRTYLDSAIGFYDRGFRIINSTLAPDYSSGEQSSMPPVSLGRLMLELSTALVFWGALVFISFVIRS